MMTSCGCNPATGPRLRVAGFLSGSGSNIRKLLEYKPRHYEVVFLFSDRADDSCAGRDLAREFSLPFFCFDIRSYYKSRGLMREAVTPAGLQARREYDQTAARLLKTFDIDLVVLGGYMSLFTLPGAVNVHPGDLSLTDGSGRRLLVGDDAVYEALKRGQTELRASTLLTDNGVDSGPLLMVSDPLPVTLPAPAAELGESRLRKQAAFYQNELKQKGDWLILPLTVELMAAGRLEVRGQTACLDGRPRPEGIRLAEAGPMPLKADRP